jgi:hypothetical protein
LLLALYMVWSFIGLNKVINHLLDGNLNAEFKLLRITYFFLVIAFFTEAVFFSFYQLYHLIVCSRFTRWMLSVLFIALFDGFTLLPIIHMHLKTSGKSKDN